MKTWVSLIVGMGGHNADMGVENVSIFSCRYTSHIRFDGIWSAEGKAQCVRSCLFLLPGMASHLVELVMTEGYSEFRLAEEMPSRPPETGTWAHPNIAARWQESILGSQQSLAPCQSLVLRWDSSESCSLKYLV